MKVLFVFILFSVFGAVQAATQCEVDLNVDGICDQYSVFSSNEDETFSNITIGIGGSDKKIKGSFELGDGGLSSGYMPGDFSLLIDYYPRNTLMTKYDFRWDLNLNDFVLYKVSGWEEPDRDEKYSIGGESVPSEDRFPRVFDVRRIECCVKFSQFVGNGPVVKNMSEDNKVAEIKKDFKYVMKKLPEGEKGALFFRPGTGGERISIPKDLVYEMTLIVEDDNVGAINDYAYYLYRNKETALAAMLLKKIHQKYPERVVATLNLADAYWGLGMKGDACPLYKNYVKKMNALGKSSRIPASVKNKDYCISR
ncbi:hypothetical protein [Pseudomonas sp. P9_31]|uniref:tetratricopeptide repeat protein n=1 Tax=Pseudomonas sp. P9_31 TaxID=3043448 RepID=UPI002A36FF85|nr:hypothetical protein [Pseudomonas sp. P9_31]WPN57831.1 hypothetical protein QMK51_27590 [Pseudomonas sp. P9_31]